MSWQTVSGALRANLLHDADSRVAHDDHHEQHVLVRTGDQHEHGQDHIDGVEQRERVLAHDLANGARVHAGIHVHLAAGNPLLYLCRAQPARLHLFVHASKLLTLRGRPAPRDSLVFDVYAQSARDAGSLEQVHRAAAQLLHRIRQHDIGQSTRG